MDSPRTSEPRWYDPGRKAFVEGPAEWREAWLVLDAIDAADGAFVGVSRQGEALAVSARWIDGRPCVVAEWPRADAGRHRVVVRLHAAVAWSGEVLVEPTKINLAAFEAMLDDLTRTLPAEVALSLAGANALAGLRTVVTRPVTWAGELERLRRVILGTAARPGVAAIVEAVARDPHAVLQEERRWVPIERSRRAVPSELARAWTRGGDLLDAATPARLVEARARRTLDVYENRVVCALVARCERRLRRLERAVAVGPSGLRGAAGELRTAMRRTHHAARALEGVGALAAPPDRVTMVLTRRPPYRAALDALLDLNRAAVVDLRAPELDAPLEGLPSLFQTWASLRVLARMLVRAEEAGWRVVSQRLARVEEGDVAVELLRDNRAAIELARGGEIVRAVPERHYEREGVLRSASHPQRPDLAIERCSREGEHTVWVLDPKYKIEGDGQGDGRPVKADIDKMHAYRDAIRDASDRRVVRFAATLYPGPTMRWGNGIAALRTHPADPAALEEAVDPVLQEALR